MSDQHSFVGFCFIFSLKYIVREGINASVVVNFTQDKSRSDLFFGIHGILLFLTFVIAECHNKPGFDMYPLIHIMKRSCVNGVLKIIFEWMLWKCGSITQEIILNENNSQLIMITLICRLAALEATYSRLTPSKCVPLGMRLVVMCLTVFHNRIPFSYSDAYLGPLY